MAAAPANASASPHAEPRQRIAVIGLGSIGGAVAGCLVAAGRHHVVACTREPIERLTLESPAGTAELPLAALTDPAQVAEPADWVMLCTKTHQTASAAPWLSRLCTPATRVAVLQNGIGHVERVAPLANGAAVLPVDRLFQRRAARSPIAYGCDKVSEHDIAVADDAAGRSFAQLFAGTPLRSLKSGDFTTLVWRKLLINAVANPITALTLQRQAVLRRPDVQELCLKILDEAVAVARAEGAAVADESRRAP